MNDLENIASKLFDSMFSKPEPPPCAYELVELESGKVSCDDTWLGATWHLHGENITENTAKEMKSLLLPLEDKIKSVVKEAVVFVEYVGVNPEHEIDKPYVRIRMDWGNDLLVLEGVPQWRI